MLEFVKNVFLNSSTKDLYIVASTIIALYFIFYSMYSKIKYNCLEKACEKIAEAEKMTDLSGEEKFALVLAWINNDLPNVFKNSIMQKILESIINYTYKNCYTYAKNYIKRKTGCDISEIVNTIAKAEKDTVENIKEQNNIDKETTPKS